MRAAIPDLFRFCIILLGTMLFMDADVLNRYPDHPVALQQDMMPCLKEGKTSQSQSALLLTGELEQYLQECSRSGFKAGGPAGGMFLCAFTALVPVKEKRLKGNSLQFTSPVPIFLKVLSLRL